MLHFCVFQNTFPYLSGHNQFVVMGKRQGRQCLTCLADNKILYARFDVINHNNTAFFSFFKYDKKFEKQIKYADISAKKRSIPGNICD
jgi:hypothetical protein